MSFDSVSHSTKFKTFLSK